MGKGEAGSWGTLSGSGVWEFQEGEREKEREKGV
jgi:hypothetical protein